MDRGLKLDAGGLRTGSPSRASTGRHRSPSRFRGYFVTTINTHSQKYSPSTVGRALFKEGYGRRIAKKSW